MPLTAQSTEPDPSGDLVSEIGSEFKVAIDRWSAGQIGVSDLIVVGAIFAFAAAAAWVVRRLTRRWTKDLDGLAATAGLVLGQLASVAIYLVALGLGLEVLGFGLGPVVIIVLILALVVMFVRPLIENLSSGLVLQLRGPFAPGDLVESHGIIGVVEQVNTRTVVLITGDGTTVHIPSRDVLDHMVVNHSTLGRRRSTISLHVQWGAEIDEATNRLRDAVAAADHVLADPPVEAVFVGFDGSQLCMDVLFWHEPELSTARAARSGASRAILQAFEGQAVEGRGLTLADPMLQVMTSPLDAIAGQTD